MVQNQSSWVWEEGQTRGLSPIKGEEQRQLPAAGLRLQRFAQGVSRTLSPITLKHSRTQILDESSHRSY